MKRQIKLIINVEAQKDFHPGYSLMTRGIFYGARMISAQKGTEFKERQPSDKDAGSSAFAGYGSRIKNPVSGTGI
ncbi:hypothetical protein B5F07_06840 [Lachnoclostridium sp. An169]|nr:hypothetical protein B5F07_06840 [Lachnoclostridium sp. An169]